ncbi:MAG: hypothetical protein FWD60_03775 [Candidatus Azobacteroides sp.]|nr:hypothetical protein [Candidatus Azobacteroides sp.]
MTSRCLILFLFLLTANLTFGQVTFTVEDFSNDYVGKVYISDTTEVFSPGWVAIFEKSSKKQIIKVESDELSFDLHDGKLLANIKSLPYGEQSLIIYEDFNFDGKKDFAIMDGQNSCYHGPSFQIYLSTGNGFKYSEDFTQLAQEYCGMFDVDSQAKEINVMTKDGCCWHQYSTFIVENNKPKAIRIIEDDQTDFPFSTSSEEVWNGEKMIKTSERTIDLDEEGIQTILRFHVDKNGKDIILFNINDRTLNYVVIDKRGLVEFSYPLETVYQNPDFIFDSKKSAITFKNKNVVYKVYNESGKVGIEINIDGKIYNWIGNNQTKQGTLNDLLKTKLDNVVIN